MTVQNFMLMTGAMLPRKRMYKYIDGINDVVYYCDAEHGSALTSPVWRVIKGALNVDGEIEEVWETDSYNNPATDLGTVQALSYR